jgi:hypothetical protein
MVDIGIRVTACCRMDTPTKKPRGRPKLPWEPIFSDELFRRLQAGLALETVEAEAKWIAAWAASRGLQVEGSKPLQHERIRERIKKRYGGADGYKSARRYHQQELERMGRLQDEATKSS